MLSIEPEKRDTDLYVYNLYVWCPPGQVCNTYESQSHLLEVGGMKSYKHVSVHVI